MTPDMLNELATFKNKSLDTTLADYDADVQDVLNQYWPGTSGLECIKRGARNVYTAQYQGTNVVVKSTEFSNELEDDWQLYASYVNFIGEQVSVADYVDPYVEHSSSGKKLDKKLVSVSKFAQGQCPECIHGYQFSWITNESVVRSIGGNLANMRLASQEYMKKHHGAYKKFPSWDEIGNGW